MKSARQSKIIELIEEYDIMTQEELSELLSKAGFQNTQATISRDIRELKLTKVTTSSGKPRYALQQPQDMDIWKDRKSVV